MQQGKGRTRLLASGIPVVETWDLTPTPIDMLVGFSHLEIGHEVANFFIGQGRRRLGIVQANDERANSRSGAFAEVVAQNGLGDVTISNVGASRSIQSGREAMGQLDRKSTRLTSSH